MKTTYILKDGRQVSAGDRVEIVQLCNEEPHYHPGDKGTVEIIDDANQIHVRWDNGGSIALLEEDAFRIIKTPQSLFIVLEGGEGCGKSTVSKELKKRLEDRGCKVLLTREPGGTPFGEEIRNFILNSPNLSPSVETNLFLAARVHHGRKIQDHLASSTSTHPAIVICDRYMYSNMVYQGYVVNEMQGKMLAKKVYEQNLAARVPVPDLVFFLDCSPEIGLNRIRQNQRETNRFDEKSIEEHKKIREGFQKISEIIQEENVRVNAEEDFESIVQNMLEKIQEKMMEGKYVV